MPLGTSYVVKTLRLLESEDGILQDACDALGGMELSQLVQEAVLFEAFRLGVRFSTSAPPPRTSSWPYLPDRVRSVTGVRISISMRITVAELMSTAAAHVDVSEPLFIIGSTLAYIGRLQKCYRASQIASPREAEHALAELRKIPLPPRYRYRAS